MQIHTSTTTVLCFMLNFNLLSLNFRKIDWLVAAKKDILKRKICYLVKIFDLSFVRISKYHKDTVITNELSSIIPRVWKLE